MLKDTASVLDRSICSNFTSAFLYKQTYCIGNEKGCVNEKSNQLAGQFANLIQTVSQNSY